MKYLAIAVCSGRSNSCTAIYEILEIAEIYLEKASAPFRKLTSSLPQRHNIGVDYLASQMRF